MEGAGPDVSRLGVVEELCHQIVSRTIQMAAITEKGAFGGGGWKPVKLIRNGYFFSYSSPMNSPLLRLDGCHVRLQILEKTEFKSHRCYWRWIHDSRFGL